MEYDNKDEFITKVKEIGSIMDAIYSNDNHLKFSGFLAARKALPFIKKDSLQEFLLQYRASADASKFCQQNHYRANADAVLLFRRDIEHSFGYHEFQGVVDLPDVSLNPWEARLVKDKEKLGFINYHNNIEEKTSKEDRDKIVNNIQEYLKNNKNKNFIHHCICLSEPKTIDSYWFLKKDFFIEGLDIYKESTTKMDHSVDLIKKVQDYVTLRRMEMNIEKSVRHKDLRGYFTNAKGTVMSGITQYLDKDYRVLKSDGPSKEDVLAVRKEIMGILTKKYFNNFKPNI